MLGLGVLYDTGHGVPQNFATALAWYRRAAEAGDMAGAFNVAAMNDSGRGTPVNRAEAVRWYKRAASGGYGRAAYNLGVIYRDGDGVRKDRAAAIQYFNQAVRLGIPAGRSSLLAMGAIAPRPAPGLERRETPLPPTAPDEVQAIADSQKAALARAQPEPGQMRAFAEFAPLFEAQAARGNHLSQYDAGFAYQFGLGVQADPVKAYVYYLRAAADGAPDIRAAALTGAGEVGQQMSPEQHRAARVQLLDAGP